MFSLISSLFKSFNSRILSGMSTLTQTTIDFRTQVRNMSDDEFPKKTEELRLEIQSHGESDKLIALSFALVREAASRVLKMEHFLVQIQGGLAMHKGMIVEMKTGEGKTLVATLPAYINALYGKGVHVVTVNDYLAKRDSVWMGKVYKFLGLTIGCVTSDTNIADRKKAYDCDITYVTNNELGFDYLRDNMRMDNSSLVQRGLFYAIIDEIDSILIDEARTPLIISGAVEENVSVFKHINRIVSGLKKEHVEIDEKSKSVSLTDSGVEKLEILLLENGLINENTTLYDVENVDIVGRVDQSLKAHFLFSLDKEYIVKDSKVLIVDEFTGRVMEGRRFSEGLHQALEAKEDVRINKENHTLASITFQNLFRMYDKLCGMTGTAITESGEFSAIYGLKVVQIPTNLPIRREDYDDEIYSTFEEKTKAIVELIKNCNENSQPVLVGTTSISKSETLSVILNKIGLKHRVLNARYHAQEASIIAQAGAPGSITIATNMAGRGTDIKLGGTPLSEEDGSVEKIEENRRLVAEAGGLFVIGTERHESRRIDNQLRGRSGRQGDPGASKFFLSLDDDLLRIFGSSKIKGMLAKLGLQQGESIHHPWITKAIQRAQSKVESQNYEIRKSLLSFDDVMNEQRKIVFKKRNSIINSESCDISDLLINVNRKIVFSSSDDNQVVDLDLMKSEINTIYGLTFDYSGGMDFLHDVLHKLVQKEFQKKEEIMTPEVMNFVKKRIMLVSLDFLWKDHLASLEYLKKSITLRAVAQKNPVNEFKEESFVLLKSLIYEWEEMVVSRIFKISVEK